MSEAEATQVTTRPARPRTPPVKFRETQALIREISQVLGAPFISYWHNPRGSVRHHEVVAFYKALEQLGKGEQVYLFIKSDGGSGEAAYRIVALLREFFGRFHALVPLECASAATMIVLGANTLHMGPMSYLTAVDTSLTHDLSPIDRDNDRVSVSLDELKRVIQLWQSQKDQTASNPYKSIFEYVHPLVIGAVDRADSLSTMLCRDILSYHISDEHLVVSIAEALNAKYPSHSYPILRREAQRLGLDVQDMSPRVMELLLRLHELYSEMGQKCTTDYDEIRSHTHEVSNIIETSNLQLVFEIKKDWFYRVEERKWVTMNDTSGWHRLEADGSRIVRHPFHTV